MPTLPSILFVCMGNICRSPTAEIVWTHLLKTSLPNGIRLPLIDSAGTIAYHQGEAPDARMQVALKKAGYIPFGTSRKISQSDFDNFDLILAMDHENLRTIRSMAKSAGKACDQCHLFLDFAGIGKELEVPDPYYGGSDGFKHVVQLVESACDSLLRRLSENSE